LIVGRANVVLSTANLAKHLEYDVVRGKPPFGKKSSVIMVIADEAHRSQYDLIDGLARNLRDSLPNASFIGLTPSLPSSVGLRPALRAVYVGRRPPSPFTGTPIEKTDANTRAVFGDLSFPGSTSMPPSFLNALSRG
jgi:hypothetical protein